MNIIERSGPPTRLNRDKRIDSDCRVQTWNRSHTHVHIRRFEYQPKVSGFVNDKKARTREIERVVVVSRGGLIVGQSCYCFESIHGVRVTKSACDTHGAECADTTKEQYEAVNNEQKIVVDALRSAATSVIGILRDSARTLNNNESDLLFDPRLPALVRARLGTVPDIHIAFSEAVSILIRLNMRRTESC